MSFQGLLSNILNTLRFSSLNSWGFAVHSKCFPLGKILKSSWSWEFKIDFNDKHRRLAVKFVLTDDFEVLRDKINLCKQWSKILLWSFPEVFIFGDHGIFFQRENFNEYLIIKLLIKWFKILQVISNELFLGIY